jgi:hypothetical protein
MLVASGSARTARPTKNISEGISTRLFPFALPACILSAPLPKIAAAFCTSGRRPFRMPASAAMAKMLDNGGWDSSWRLPMA